MNVLANENIDAPIVEKLRNDGIDVCYIKEVDKGASDIEVLNRAVEEKRVIVTLDSDFNEIASEHDGIIRITRPDRHDVIVELIEDLLETFTREDFENTVTEVSPSEYR